MGGLVQKTSWLGKDCTRLARAGGSNPGPQLLRASLNHSTKQRHNILTSKIKKIIKTKPTALLAQHRHYMNTNFNKLGCGPTLAHQVWVAYMEMAISIAKVAKGNFCTQETLQKLQTPLTIPTFQHTPIMTLTNVCNTSPNPPPPFHHALFVTPEAHARRTSSSKTPYSKSCTNHRSLTPPHHPTLFPIFLRHHNTSRSKSPHQYIPLFYPAVAPQPYDKISAHLHRLHIWKKALPLPLGLAWSDSILLCLY